MNTRRDKMIHTEEQVLRKARFLAKRILELGESKEVNGCRALDDIVAEARYIEFETREYDETEEDPGC